MRLAPKIVAPLLLLGAVTLLVAGAAWWIVGELSRITQAESRIRAETFQAGEIRSMSRVIQRDLLKATMFEWDGKRAEFGARVSRRADWLEAETRNLKARVGASDPTLVAFFADQDKAFAGIKLVQALIAAGDIPAARREIAGDLETFSLKASITLDGYIRSGETKIAALSEEAASWRSRAPLALLAIAGLALTLSLTGSLAFAVTGLVRPLAALGREIRAIAEGDYGTPTQGTGRADELGQIARDIETFRLDLSASSELRERQVALEAEAHAQELRAHEASERSARDQMIVVKAVGEALSCLACGDLTTRITVTFPGAYAALRDDFNAAVIRLEETVATIAANTDTIRSGANEITQAAEDLARRTEQQAASLEQTVVALGQITSGIGRTAEGAAHASGLVDAASRDAEGSGEVVRQAIHAMQTIEHSSGEIGQIIGVIDEIAFQTNLLALNAGVEAARAGDAGRGFALVAQEVRALAQRSAGAAREIKALVETSTGQVGSGVGLVGHAGSALERIAAQVARINTIASEIASSSAQQATGLREVNTAIVQMDEVTQKNAAMVEQSTAAARSLSTSVATLQSMVSTFRLRDAIASVQPTFRPDGALRRAG